MNHVLTERQRELVELAGKLADQFAERAAEHDRDNTFPFENYEDLRSAGFLRLTVPEELGGGDATLHEVLPVLERLAMGDASTALAVTMHISPLGQWASVWRQTGNPRLADLLRMAAEDRLIWASVTAEPGLRNDMTEARTAAVKVAGGFRLTGRKSYATVLNCPRSFLARAGSRALTRCLPSSRVGRWATFGAPQSRHRRPDSRPRWRSSGRAEHRSRYEHGPERSRAQRISERAYQGVSFAAPGGASGPAMPGPRSRAGRPATEQRRGKASRQRPAHASGASKFNAVQGGIARCALVKYVASNNATQVLHKLVDILGGASYSRKLPFERMWRDAQAGVFMPMSNTRARTFIGASALGVALAPVIDFDETGHESRAS